MNELSDEVLVALGATAAVALLLSEDAIGPIPEWQLESDVKTALQQIIQAEKLTVDDQQRFHMFVVALTLMSDQTGLANKLKTRFKSGDQTINHDEIHKIISMTATRVKEFAKR